MLDSLMQEFPDNENFNWNFDNDNFECMNEASILITDFSGIIFDFALLFDKPLIYADTKFDSRIYDAAWFKDEKLWRFKVLEKIGIPLKKEQFGDMKAIIENALNDDSLKSGREEARKQAWMHQGESTKRTVDYLVNGERGQTPFTPAVGTLIQLNEKLKRIESSGGIKNQNRLAKERALYFRNAIKDLPFKLFSNEKDSSNCVTALCPTRQGVNAHKIFEIIKDEYGIWICPNAGDMAEKVFRVGHIGSISEEEIDTLVAAFKDLVKRGIL